MAIVVPFLVQAGVTAAGYAATTAALAATITSVAFQVTGINNKINKAAAKVFGEDLVMVANVAGAVYGAVNGGFDLGGGTSSAGLTEAGGAVSTKAMLDGTDAFGANSLQGAFSPEAAVLSKAELDGTNILGNNSIKGEGLQGRFDFPKVETAQTGPAGTDMPAPTAAQGTDVIGSDSTIGKDANPLQQQTLPGSSAGAAKAAAPGASAPVAASEQQIYSEFVRPDASTPVAPPRVTGPVPGPLAPAKGSFFDRLTSVATSEKGMGMLIQGVGSGITAATNNKAKQEELAWQKQLRGVPNLYIKGAQA